MRSRSRDALLWGLAAALAGSAAALERSRLPPHEVSGHFTVDGVAREYRLPRTARAGADLHVGIPSPLPGTTGRLFHREEGDGERWQLARMAPGAGPLGHERLLGTIPARPAGTTIEYRLEAGSPFGVLRIPDGTAAGETIVARFEGAVPAPLRIAYVTGLFAAAWMAVRAGLVALAAPATLRRDALGALAAVAGAGLVLGALVQWLALGTLRGEPVRYAVAPAAMLGACLAWLAACALVARGDRSGRTGWAARAAVAAAAVLTLWVGLS